MSKSAADRQSPFAIGIVVTVVAGLLLLLIEYKSGWFLRPDPIQEHTRISSASGPNSVQNPTAESATETSEADDGITSAFPLPNRPARSDSSSLSDLQLEVVFVMDDTAIMARMRDAVQEVVRRCAHTISGNQLVGDVRFGLVQYHESHSTLVSALQSDVTRFRQTVSNAEVASIPSNKSTKDALAGIVTAIKDAGWRTNSCKHIIVLGSKAPCLKGSGNTTGLTVEQVIRMAQPDNYNSDSDRARQSIMLHTVAVCKAPAHSPDLAELKETFSTIAHNNGYETGSYSIVDPTDSTELATFVDDLADALTSGVRVLGSIRDTDR